jgi:hypothetical protein
VWAGRCSSGPVHCVLPPPYRSGLGSSHAAGGCRCSHAPTQVAGSRTGCSRNCRSPILVGIRRRYRHLGHCLRLDGDRRHLPVLPVSTVFKFLRGRPEYLKRRLGSNEAMATKRRQLSHGHTVAGHDEALPSVQFAHGLTRRFGTPDNGRLGRHDWVVVGARGRIKRVRLPQSDDSPPVILAP